jgi:hypothetical protein
MNDTILHFAAYKKNKIIIKHLLKLNVNIDLPNSVSLNYLIFKRGLRPIDVCEDPDNELKSWLTPKN